MLKKISLKAKIIAGISTAAVVGSVAVLVAIQANGGVNKTNSSWGNDSISGTNPVASISGSEKPAIISKSTKPAKPVIPATKPFQLDIPATKPSQPDAPATKPPTLQKTGNITKRSLETFYAQITNWSECMLPYATGFTFETMDWLTGQEAADKYRLDYPGCTPEQAEIEVSEYGYIRKANTPSRWLMTAEDTVYYLQDKTSENAAVTVQVDYHTFLNQMIPAIETNMTQSTFVKVTVFGEHIVKIEWVYLP